MSSFIDLILRADTTGMKGAETALDGVSNAGRRTEQSTSRATAAISAGFAAVAVAAASAVASALSFRAAFAAISRIDAMDEAAQSIDATVNALRALQLATGEAGIGAGELMTSMQAMNREIAKAAEEAGPARDAIAKLGLSADALSNMDADTRLATIADAMNRMGLSAGQATAILQDLGVRSKAMSVALLAGGDAIRAARRDIADLGLELDQNAVEAVARANDALGRMSLATEALGNQIAVSLAPALTAMAEGFVNSLREGGALNTIIDALAFSISTFTNNIDVLAISIGVLAVRSMIGFVASLGSVGIALAASLMATNALAFAMTALPLVGLVAGLTLAWRWYNSTDEATRAAATATDIASAANLRMQSTLQGVIDGLAQTEDALISVSIAETMVASQAAAQAASQAFDQVSVDIYDVMRANIDLGTSTLETNTLFNNLVAAVRNGSVSLEELKDRMDRAAQAKPELAPFIAELMQSIDAADQSAASVDRLAAMMRYLEGEASAADVALLQGGQSAGALSRTLSSMSLGGNVTGQVAFLAQTLGVALDVATALNSTLNANANIDMGGGDTGPGLTFGLSAPDIQDVGDAVLDFGRTTNRARREIVDLSSAAVDLSANLGGGGGSSGGGGVAGAAAAVAEEMTEAEIAAKSFADTMEGHLLSAVDGLVDQMLGGFKDGFAGIWASFKKMILDMVGFAIKNQIRLAITGGAGAGIGAVGGAVAQSGSGILSSITGALASAGAAFTTGLSSVVSGLFSGGLGGAFGAVQTALAGATTGLAGFATAAGAIALPLLAVAGIFMAFKKKTTELDSGLRLTINGFGTLAEKFQTIKTTMLFGLIKNTNTNFSGAGQEVSGEMDEAFQTVKQSIRGMADVLGVGGKALNRFSHTFTLSLKGMTESQANTAIAAEFAIISDKLAGMAGVTRAMIREGETATQALTRMSSSLISANAAFETLGFSLYDVSLAGGRSASAMIDLYGSLDQFAQATEFYYQNFYTLAERTRDAARQFQDGLTGAGVSASIRTIAQFRAEVDRLMNLRTGTGAAQAAELIQLAPLFQQMLELQSQAVTTGGAIEDLSGALQTATDFANERAGLERRILELQGNTQALRGLELDGLFNSNRRLLEHIFALEDQAAAADAAAEAIRQAAAAHQEIADERRGLWLEILNLRGDTASLRAHELALLDPLNRDLQIRIWAMEDEAEALALVQAAAEEALQQARAVADERLGLETRLLTLQGNTAELRARELAALDPANRALQQMIWGLEDAAAAMDALDPEAFATRLDYERARALSASGIAGTASQAVFNAPAMIVGPQSNVIELQAVRNEMAAMRAEQRQLGMNIAATSKGTRDALRKWDTDGTPAVRT